MNKNNDNDINIKSGDDMKYFNKDKIEPLSESTETVLDDDFVLREFSLNKDHPLSKGLLVWGGDSNEGFEVLQEGFNDRCTVLCLCVGCKEPSSSLPVGVIHRESNWQINWDHTHNEFRSAVAYQSKNGKWNSVSLGKLEANKQYMLGLTLDNDEICGYKNGEKMGCKKGGDVSEQKWPAVVGSHSVYNNRNFNGLVHLYFIWNRVLSEGEMFSIHRYPLQFLIPVRDSKNKIRTCENKKG